MKIIEKLKLKAKLIKQNLTVLIYAYKDKRTPILPKLIIGFTVGYMLSPIDLIPDFIPILGLLDDLIIVPLLIKFSIKLIPKEIMDDAKKKILENEALTKKSNWIFGLIVILIWIAVICYFTFFIFDAAGIRIFNLGKN